MSEFQPPPPPLPPLCQVVDASTWLEPDLLRDLTSPPAEVWALVWHYLHTLPATAVSSEAPRRAQLHFVAWDELPVLQYCKVTLSFFADSHSPAGYVLEYHRLSGSGTNGLSRVHFRHLCVYLQQHGALSESSAGGVLPPPSSPEHKVWWPVEEEEEEDPRAAHSPTLWQQLHQQALCATQDTCLEAAYELIFLRCRAPSRATAEADALDWLAVVQHWLGWSARPDWRLVTGAAMLWSTLPAAVKLHAHASLQSLVARALAVEPAEETEDEPHRRLLRQHPAQLWAEQGFGLSAEPHTATSKSP